MAAADREHLVLGVVWWWAALCLIAAPAVAQGTSAAQQPPPHEELDAGTDPSKSSRRLNLYHEYYKIENGFSFNTTNAVISLPILGGGGSLTLTIPFTYAELPQVRPFGIGDVKVKVMLIPTLWPSLKSHWSHPRVIPFAGTEFGIPTADSTLRLDPAANRITTLSLGTGKYRLSVLGGAAWSAARRWLIIPLYQQETSIAGDPSFDDISQGTLRLFVQYQHPSGVYIKPEFQWVFDFKDDNRLDFYIAPEVGQVLRGATVVYVKPGFGLVDDPNNRNWGLEFGIRQKF